MTSKKQSRASWIYDICFDSSQNILVTHHSIHQFWSQKKGSYHLQYFELCSTGLYCLRGYWLFLWCDFTNIMIKSSLLQLEGFINRKRSPLSNLRWTPSYCKRIFPWPPKHCIPLTIIHMCKISVALIHFLCLYFDIWYFICIIWPWQWQWPSCIKYVALMFISLAWLECIFCKLHSIIFIYHNYSQHIYDSVNERNSLHITAVKALVWNNGTLLCKIDFNRNLSF